MKLQLSIAIIFSTLVFAEVPTIDLNGNPIEIEKLCFDSGYIREINDLQALNISPVIKRVNLNLGHGEVFKKNEIIQSQQRFYNRDNQQYEIAQLKECDISVVSDYSGLEEVERRASTAEAIVYGNLKNYGIDDIFRENWKLYESFEGYLKRGGDKARISLEKNLSFEIQNIDISSYSDWNNFSKKYIGGEQSGGGGSGKIRVSFNMNSGLLVRSRKEKQFLEKVLNLNTTYENVILSKEKLPRAQMFIKEVK